MNTTETELEGSYRCCRDIARRRAGNFYYSFAVLPRLKRDAMCAVYAFMRYCDDIADDPGLSKNREAMLERWRESLEMAVQGQCAGSAILPAFHDAMLRFHIPERYFHLLIDGATMDLALKRYDTFDQLYEYCYRVASAVGLVCIHIFGFDTPDAERYAEYCGIAFQLTNILRDLKEDASMGRVYIPEDDLWAFGYSADELAEGVQNDKYQALMRFEVDRARDFYRAALPLVPLVHESGRPGLRAMIGIYSGILDKIERHNYDVFASDISLSRTQKMAIAAKAVLKSKVDGGKPSRIRLQS